MVHKIDDKLHNGDVDHERAHDDLAKDQVIYDAFKTAQNQSNSEHIDWASILGNITVSLDQEEQAKEAAKMILTLVYLEEKLHKMAHDANATAGELAQQVLTDLQAINITTGNGTVYNVTTLSDAAQEYHVEVRWGNGSIADVIQEMKSFNISATWYGLTVDQLVGKLQAVNITENELSAATVYQIIKQLKETYGVNVSYNENHTVDVNIAHIHLHMPLASGANSSGSSSSGGSSGGSSSSSNSTNSKVSVRVLYASVSRTCD